MQTFRLAQQPLGDDGLGHHPPPPRRLLAQRVAGSLGVEDDEVGRRARVEMPVAGGRVPPS
jgi:hypothetical protein